MRFGKFFIKISSRQKYKKILKQQMTVEPQFIERRKNFN